MEYTLTKNTSLALADKVLETLEGDRKEIAFWIRKLHEKHSDAFRVVMYSAQEDDMIHFLLRMDPSYDGLIEEAVLSGHTAKTLIMEAVADWTLSMATKELLDDCNDADIEEVEKGQLYDALSESEEIADYVFGKIRGEHKEIEEMPAAARLLTYSHKRSNHDAQGCGCGGGCNCKEKNDGHDKQCQNCN